VALATTLSSPTVSAFQPFLRTMVHTPIHATTRSKRIPALAASQSSSDEQDVDSSGIFIDSDASTPLPEPSDLLMQTSKLGGGVWPQLSSISKYAAASFAVALITTVAVGQPGAAWASNAGAAITAQTASWWGALVETGFYQAFSLVFLSEIGDKTFFIAGLLAMKTSKLVSFLGSMGALAVMTFISVAIGQIFHAVPSGFADGIPLDDVAACLAFAFFGLKTLKDALDMEEGESVMDEELAEAEEEVEESKAIKQVTKFGQLASIFGLVFAAEFGDRSFLSTIALSAAQNPLSVAAGGIAAHGVATGIAVSGGSYLAKYISEKVIGIIGGTLFLVFAVTTALGIF